MAIHYTCSQCGAKLESHVSMAGLTDICPICGTEFEVPQPPHRRRLFMACGISAVAAAGIAITVLLLLNSNSQTSSRPPHENPQVSSSRTNAESTLHLSDKPSLPGDNQPQPIAEVENYYGRWLIKNDKERICVTIRPNGTATVDFQLYEEFLENDVGGAVFTHPYSYDTRRGIIRLRGGVATLRDDGSLQVAYKKEPLDFKRILPKDKTTPRTVRLSDEAKGPGFTQPSKPIRTNRKSASPAPSSVVLVDDNVIRISPPHSNWPESEWDSVRISLLKQKYTKTDKHLMPAWGDKFNQLSIAVGLSKAMREQMGMMARNKFQDMDVITSNTPTGKKGIIVCGFQNRREPGKKLLRVGTVLSYFHLNDWKDKRGNLLISLPNNYWDGPGRAKIYLCDRKEVALATHTLSLGMKDGAAASSTKINKLQKFRRLKGHTTSIWSVDFTPDGQHLLTGSGKFYVDENNKDNTLRLWDIETGRQLASSDSLSSRVIGVGVLTGGRTVCIATETDLQLWSVKPKLRFSKGLAEGLSVKSFSLSGDRKCLAAFCLKTKEICLWKMPSANLLAKVAAKSYSLALDKAAETLLFCPGEKEVGSFNISNQRKNTALLRKAKWGWVKALAVSPDGSTGVAAYAYIPALTVFRVSDGKIIRTLGETTVKNKDGWVAVSGRGRVNAIDFSPCGNRIAVAGDRGDVDIWDISSGKKLHSFSIGKNNVHAVRFSPDGKLLAAGGRDCWVELWNIP